MRGGGVVGVGRSSTAAGAHGRPPQHNPHTPARRARTLSCLTCMVRTTTIILPPVLRKRSLTRPLTSVMPDSLGSCTNDAPGPTPGGIAPVVEYLRHSMMVVLPHPFAPTIIVSGV